MARVLKLPSATRRHRIEDQADAPGATAPLRVATLTRRSTDEEHQPYSIEAQDQRLDAYIRSQEGWQLVLKYTDDMSGTVLNRPGLQRALADARLKRYDVLLVYRVDRLARSVRLLAHVLEEVDKAGVTFRSATEPFDTSTPAGRLMVQMLGVFAEFERATIIDRVIAGMERKAARGGWNGGSVPWGYGYNNVTGFLDVNPDESPLVPVMFDLYLNRRLGANNVANWLNERGHRTRGGKPWSFKLVLTILRNRVYLGEVFFRDRWYPASHPALIDADVFNRVQALLDERGEDYAKRRTNPSDYLVGGMVVCAACGRHFVGTAAHGKIYDYRYYTCYSRQRYGKDTCGAERVDAGRLDSAVLDSLLRTLHDQRLLDESVEEYLARSRAAKPNTREQAAAVQAEIRRTEEALDRYFNAFETGKMSEDLCRPRIEALAEKLRGLQSRHAELTAAMDDEELTAPSTDELEKMRATVQHAIEHGPNTLRKAVLQQFVVEVRIESRRVIWPTFRLPLGGVRELSRMVEAAGVEPASETECPGTSTSVSGILLSPRGSSQRDPRWPAAVSVPDRGRGALGPASRVFCDTASPARRRSRGRRPGARPGDSCFRYLGGESESPIVGVGICVPCAVTHTPSARYPETLTAPSRPDAPTCNELLGRILPGPGRVQPRGVSGGWPAPSRAWRRPRPAPAACRTGACRGRARPRPSRGSA